MSNKTDETDFANRVRSHFPEGLTGVISPGGTRSAYILAYNRHNKNPGKIDFADYAEKTFISYCQLLLNFFELGGQNIIDAAPPLGLALTRSPEYIQKMTQYYLTYISQPMQDSYRKMQIDPYFVGLEAIMDSNSTSVLHQYGQRLIDFMETWPYNAGNRKLIFEISPIPLYSLWHSFQAMSASDREHLDNQLRSEVETDFNKLNNTLYRYFIRAIYGFELPPPHFTLSTNAKGSCKAYLSMPTLFSSGINMKFFYTPYSPIHMKRGALKRIIEDLIAPKQSVSHEMDYRTQSLSSQNMATAFVAMQELIDDFDSILGLTK